MICKQPATFPDISYRWFQYFSSSIIVHNCLLSVDRYIAILHPLRYNVIVTTKRVKRALVIAWFSQFASACIGSLAYSDEQAISFRLGVIGCLSYSSEPPLSKKIHSALNFVGFGLIPILVTTFVYGRIAKVSWRQSNRTEPGTRLNPEQDRRQRKEMKWMKTIGKRLVSLQEQFVQACFISLIYCARFYQLICGKIFKNSIIFLP